MGQTKRKTASDLLDDVPVHSQTSRSVLHDIAVAIDPPPDGAIGIRELLDRLDFMAEADFFSPKEGSLDAGLSPLNQSLSWNIYDFADPEEFIGPLDITDWNGDDLQLILREMIRIRVTSNILAGKIKEGQTTAPLPPSISLEALPTGLARNTSPQDQVIRSDEFWNGIETTVSGRRRQSQIKRSHRHRICQCQRYREISGTRDDEIVSRQKTSCPFCLRTHTSIARNGIHIEAREM